MPLNKTHWIYDSQLLIAISIYCLCGFVFELTGIHNVYYQIAVSLLCFVSYKFQLVQKTNTNLLLLFLILAFCSVLIIYSLIDFFTVSQVLFFIPLLLMSLLYKSHLRTSWILKTPIIALSWALLIVVPIWDNMLMVLFAVFCFVFSITLPFDIRDTEQDQGNIKTIPLVFGTYMSLFLAFVLYVIWALLLNNLGLNLGFNVMIGVISLIVIGQGYRKRAAFYYYVLLDGLPVVYYLLYLGFKHYLK